LIRDIFATIACLGILHHLDYVHALDHFAENHVLIVKERSRDSGDEELRAITVRACVLWEVMLVDIERGGLGMENVYSHG
jgi:hypothetical protein